MSAASERGQAMEDEIVMTPDEFVERFLYPAFNMHDDIDSVEPCFGSVSTIGQTLDVTMSDGTVWQISILLTNR